MMNGNGQSYAKVDRRNVLTFLSGGIVTLAITLVVMVLTIGGERRVVLDHVAATEPLRSQATMHFADGEKHLNEAEATVIAALPSKMNEIDHRLSRIEQEQREVRKILDEILRRVR